MTDKKGIFFDIGYTLCRMNTGDWRATNKFYQYVSKEYMQQLPLEIIQKAYMAGDAVLNQHPYVMSVEEEYEMNVVAYRAMIREFPEISVSEKQIQEIAKDRTYNMDNYFFYDGLPELFATLHEKYKIGIISDTWPSADSVLKKAGIFDYIDSFTYSCYLGVTKPNPNMYRHALDAIGLSGEETIFIDDAIKNLEAAGQFGIEGVLILTKEKKGASQFKEIEKIGDITQIVKK